MYTATGRQAVILPLITSIQRRWLFSVCWMVLVSTMVGAEPSETGITRQPEDDQRLQVVITYADNVLEQGRDRWSGQDTPLLADGIDPVSGTPALWIWGDRSLMIHNLASQQNLFRVLRSLTNLTGEDRYEQAARDAIRYHFEHLRSPCGKLHWGGHQIINLNTLEPEGRFDANCHEFKNNFPFYELMWDVDHEATADFLRAFWQGHIMDWQTLALNRHASYGEGPPPTAAIWDQPFDDPPPFFDSTGLSFLNCGSDLIYSGGMLFLLADEPGALEWAKRLAKMYTKSRHPETGMGSYQFTKPRRSYEPPDEGPLLDPYTRSGFGDRMENKFGHSGSSDPDDEFYNPIKDKVADDGMLVAREGWAWSFSGGFPWYTLVQLALAELLGDEGQFFADDAADHLQAHAQYAYDPEQNHFRPIWADGTDVTGFKIPRTGYGRGSKGDVYTPTAGSAQHLVSYVRAYRLTQRPALWETARAIARGLQLGEIGTQPGMGVALNAEAPTPNPTLVFALLDMYQTNPHPMVLDTARRIADRMVEARFHYGFFMPSADHLYANFNTEEPLAILALEAVLRGTPDSVPPYVSSRGYIHGNFEGHGRTYDSSAVWGRKRNEDTAAGGDEQP